MIGSASSFFQRSACVSVSEQILCSEVIRLFFRYYAAPLVCVDRTIQFSPKAVQIPRVSLLPLYIFTKSFFQILRKVHFKIWLLRFRVIRRHGRFHVQRNQFFHCDPQRSGQLHQSSSAAPFQPGLPGPDIRQRRPGYAAPLRQLVPCHILFSHHFLKRHNSITNLSISVFRYQVKADTLLDFSTFHCRSPPDADDRPWNLPCCPQISCLDFPSLAKDLDDGFSAPICVHILSPPRSLLQLYRTRIMSNIPLHFFKIISRVSKS